MATGAHQEFFYRVIPTAGLQWRAFGEVADQLPAICRWCRQRRQLVAKQVLRGAATAHCHHVHHIRIILIGIGAAATDMIVRCHAGSSAFIAVAILPELCANKVRIRRHPLHMRTGAATDFIAVGACYVEQIRPGTICLAIATEPPPGTAVVVRGTTETE